MSQKGTAFSEVYFSGSKLHTETLKITGMTCGGCAGMSPGHYRLSWRSEVSVSHAAGEAHRPFDKKLVSIDQLEPR